MYVNSISYNHIKSINYMQLTKNTFQ